jgi:hypothetical protein
MSHTVFNTGLVYNRQPFNAAKPLLDPDVYIGVSYAL